MLGEEKNTFEQMQAAWVLDFLLTQDQNGLLPPGMRECGTYAQEAAKAAGEGTLNSLSSDGVRSPAHRPNLSQVLKGLKGKSLQEALTC